MVTDGLRKSRTAGDNLSRSFILRLEVIKVQNVHPYRVQVRGFTLIEVMITVAIVAILAAVAIPNYVDYVRRGYVVDATNGLASVRANMERYYQDNPTYADVGTDFVAPCAKATPTVVGTFTLSCTGTRDGTTFTLLATGSGATADFKYTINEKEQKATTGVSSSSGWSTCAKAWILKKGAPCPT